MKLDLHRLGGHSDVFLVGFMQHLVIDRLIGVLHEVSHILLFFSIELLNNPLKTLLLHLQLLFVEVVFLLFLQKNMGSFLELQGLLGCALEIKLDLFVLRNEQLNVRLQVSYDYILLPNHLGLISVLFSQRLESLLETLITIKESSMLVVDVLQLLL